jgi:predicted oxidoreductase
MSALEKWVLHLRQVRQIRSIRVILISRFVPMLDPRKGSARKVRGKRESRKTGKDLRSTFARRVLKNR